jgi:hypothetical protein
LYFSPDFFLNSKSKIFSDPASKTATLIPLHIQNCTRKETHISRQKRKEIHFFLGSLFFFKAKIFRNQLIKVEVSIEAASV